MKIYFDTKQLLKRFWLGLIMAAVSLALIGSRPVIGTIGILFFGVLSILTLIQYFKSKKESIPGIEIEPDAVGGRSAIGTSMKRIPYMCIDNIALKSTGDVNKTGYLEIEHRDINGRQASSPQIINPNIGSNKTRFVITGLEKKPEEVYQLVMDSYSHWKAHPVL